MDCAGLTLVSRLLGSLTYSVLARNEEFSKIAVINFFFTVLKNKIQLSVGGILRGKFRDIPRKSTV